MRTKLILVFVLVLCAMVFVACEAETVTSEDTSAVSAEFSADMPSTESAAPEETAPDRPASESDISADSRDLPAVEQALPASGSSIAVDTSAVAEPGRTPELFLSADGSFGVQIPASWTDKYFVTEEAGEAAFIETTNAQADFGGVLFYVSLLLADDNRADMPGYSVVAERDGQKLVAYYPAAEQYDASDAVLTQNYAALAADVADIIASGISFCEG